MGKQNPNTIKTTGAAAGDVLVGVESDANIGLAVEIVASQPIGEGGRIKGPFNILHAGNGRYADGINILLREQAAFQTASGFLLKLQELPGCAKATHILNANALRRAEAPEAASLRPSST